MRIAITKKQATGICNLAANPTVANGGYVKYGESDAGDDDETQWRKQLMHSLKNFYWVRVHKMVFC